MKKYNLEVSEEQLMLIANCVEDCSRLMSGQTEMWNTLGNLENYSDIKDRLSNLHHLIVPELPNGGSYGWNGGDCPNKSQREFIAKTYAIYREILHQLAKENCWNNVYSSPTLTCKEGGELPIIKPKV